VGWVTATLSRRMREQRSDVSDDRPDIHVQGIARPGLGTPEALRELQRSAGNSAVVQLLRSDGREYGSLNLLRDGARRSLARQGAGSNLVSQPRLHPSATGQTAVITGENRESHVWSSQFCRVPPWTRSTAAHAHLDVRRGSRHLVTIRGNQSMHAIISAFAQAARLAGRGGRIVYSVGHGSGASNGANLRLRDDEGIVIDQAVLEGGITTPPNRAAHLAGGFTRLSAQESTIREGWLHIGQVLAAHGVSECVFLVCSIGHNRDFMRRIRTSWGGAIEITAPPAHLSLRIDELNRSRCYYRHDEPLFASHGGSTATPYSWLEMPAGLVSV
jgi:hypothetical protein